MKTIFTTAILTACALIASADEQLDAASAHAAVLDHPREVPDGFLQERTDLLNQFEQHAEGVSAMKEPALRQTFSVDFAVTQ